MVDLLQRIPLILKSTEVRWVINDASLGGAAAERSLQSSWAFLDRVSLLFNFDFDVLLGPRGRLKQTVVRLIQIVVRPWRNRPWCALKRWFILECRLLRQHRILYVVAWWKQSAQRTPTLLVTFDFHVFALIFLFFIFGVTDFLLDLISQRFKLLLIRVLGR